MDICKGGEITEDGINSTDLDISMYPSNIDR